MTTIAAPNAGAALQKAGLCVRNVGQVHGPLKAVHIDSLDIPLGMRLAIVGPSGSGKSTLLNIIGGISKANMVDRDSELSLTIPAKDDEDPAVIDLLRDHGRSNQGRIGWIFQRAFLLPDASPLSNVRVAAACAGASIKEDSFRMASRALGIRDDRHKKASRLLSGGEQQRIATLRALTSVLDAGILLADEPTASLDQDNARRVLSALAETWQQDEDNAQFRTLIFVTHDRALARKYATHFIELKAGDPSPDYDDPHWPKTIDEMGEPGEIPTAETIPDIEIENSSKQRFLRASVSVISEELLGVWSGTRIDWMASFMVQLVSAAFVFTGIISILTGWSLLGSTFGSFWAEHTGRVLVLSGITLAVFYHFRTRLEITYLSFILVTLLATGIAHQIFENRANAREKEPEYSHVLVRGEGPDFFLNAENLRTLNKVLVEQGLTNCAPGNRCIFGRFESNLSEATPIAVDAKPPPYTTEDRVCADDYDDQFSAQVVAMDPWDPTFRYYLTYSPYLPGIGEGLKSRGLQLNDVIVSARFKHLHDQLASKALEIGDYVCTAPLARKVPSRVVAIADRLVDSDGTTPEVILRADFRIQQIVSRGRAAPPFNQAAIYLDLNKASEIERFVSLASTGERQDMADAFGTDADLIRLQPQSGLDRIIAALTANKATSRLLIGSIAVIAGLGMIATLVAAMAYLSRNEAALCVLRAFGWPSTAICNHVLLRYLVVAIAVMVLVVLSFWAIWPAVSDYLQTSFGLHGAILAIDLWRILTVLFGFACVVTVGVVFAFLYWRTRARHVADLLKEVA